MKNNITEQNLPAGYKRAPRGKIEDYTDSDGVEWDVIKVGNRYYQKKKSNSNNTQTNNLPSWVPNCLKSFPNLKKTTDTTQVTSKIDEDNQYFWEDGDYRYVKKDGTKVNGTYKCVNNINYYTSLFNCV